MEDRNINADLQKLQNTLDRIKALLAWEDLKRSEARPGEPPGFVLGDTVEEDIKNQYSRFLTVRLQVRGILNSPDRFLLPEIKRVSARQKLIQVEKEFQGLNLFERFIKF